MRKEGVDADDRDAVVKSYLGGIRRHAREVKNIILEYHPEATIFFNGFPKMGPSQRLREKLYEMSTHQELEDLPTTWGGYDKLPIGAKFHLGLGYQVAAMSGKFHKSWGEFGGFKHPDAIKYEAAAMIAQGAACNFGDHMHPCGELDMGTYGNLGKAYEYVEKIEAYGPGGFPFSKLGLWLSHQEEPDQGAAALLLELHRDFSIANQSNLASLTTLVIPSHGCLSESQSKDINQWVKSGGRLIVFSEGALDTAKSKFQLDVGCDYLGNSPFKDDYTLAGPELGAGLVPTPFLNYRPGLRAKLSGGKALAMIREPYFSRTYGK
jgi:hypothetical protein